MKLKKGDKVEVLMGKYRGKTGKILTVLNDRGMALVEGVNIYKKHQKAKRQGEKGEVVLVPRPLRAANLMLVCSNCGRPTRIGHKFEGDKKIRVCKKCSAAI